MKKEIKNPIRVNVILEKSEWEAYRKTTKLALSRLVRATIKAILSNYSKNKSN